MNAGAYLTHVKPTAMPVLCANAHTLKLTSEDVLRMELDGDGEQLRASVDSMLVREANGVGLAILC